MQHYNLSSGSIAFTEYVLKKIIATQNAPAALGPYSQAVRNGNILFLSGQLGLVPKTGEMAGADAAAQARQALENLRAVLEAAGATLGNVCKTTVFLKDMSDFQEFNSVYAEYFPAEYPARSCFAVAELPKHARVEIEAIAVLDN